MRVRVALAQLAAHAAYNDPSDLLCEPDGELRGLHRLVVHPQIAHLRNQVRDRYLAYIRSDVQAALDVAIRHEADLIIFPEYSIPPSLLPALRQTANERNIVIIAGSHMITRHCITEYENSDLDHVVDIERDMRRAVCPVFVPGSPPSAVFKRHKSKWESGLVITDEPNPTVESVTKQGERYALGIAICVDGLLSELQDLCNMLTGPSLLVVTARTPKTEPFLHVGEQVRMMEKAICFVNDAYSGGSRVYGWHDRSNHDPFLDQHGTLAIPKGDEAVAVVDIDLDAQFGKVGTVIFHSPIDRVAWVPIVHAGTGRSASELAQYKDAVLEMWEREGIARSEDVAFARECIETVSPELGVLEEELKRQAALALKTLPESEDVTGLQRQYPVAVAHEGNRQEDPAVSIRPPYLGRDREIVRLREAINNPTTRLIVAQGIKGIGKTALLSDALDKILPPLYERVRVTVTEGTGFSRFLLTLAERLQVPLSEASLQNSEETTTRTAVESVLRAFDSTQTAYLLIDDWHHVLDRSGYRSPGFRMFIDAILSRPYDGNHKVLIASQTRLGLDHGFAITLNLPALDDESIRGILEWYMRWNSPSTTPRIPAELIARLYGNPLAAVVASQLLEMFPAAEILQGATVSQRFQNRLIPILLEKIPLTEAELDFIGYLSVFNVPVGLEALTVYGKEDTPDLVETLFRYFLLEYDQGAEEYKIHPLIREYFAGRLPSDKRIKLHRVAAEYYGQRVSEPSRATIIDKAEYVSHLGHSLQWNAMRDQQMVFADEFRPAARALFRDHRYRDALRYYELLDDRLPPDHDVKFHIALCYAHLEDWPAAEHWIDETLRGVPEGFWVYAGYGDVLTKKHRLDEAEKYLNQALEIARRKAPLWKLSAIYQSLASVYEQRRVYGEAEAYYRKAIQTDPASGFAHYAFAKLLDKLGRQPEALTHIEMALQLDSSLGDAFRLREKLLGHSHAAVGEGEGDVHGDSDDDGLHDGDDDEGADVDV